MGMPDFVLRPRVKELGSGTRELGDGVLVVGSIAAVVQVKSRVAYRSTPSASRFGFARTPERHSHRRKGRSAPYDANRS